MKARVVKEVVLLYRLEKDTELGKAIAEAVSRAGASCRYVAADQVGETVGNLVSGSIEGKEYTGEAPEHSAMVFSGFTRNRLDDVLNRLQTADSRNKAMKAVVTDMNREWAFGDLVKELTREREAIRKQLLAQQEKAKAEQEEASTVPQQQ